MVREKATHSEARVGRTHVFFFPPKLAAAGGGEFQRGSLSSEPSKFLGVDMDRTLLCTQVLWEQFLSILGDVFPPSGPESPRWKNRLEISELTLSDLEVLVF